jgi:tripartite-type tricarboxylate transporter receptor subunit TctC
MGALKSTVIALVALGAFGSSSTDAAEPELRLVVGEARGGEAWQLAEILADPLAEALDRPVRAESIIGDDGMAAARMVVEARPDSGMLLLADNLLLAMNEANDAWPFAIDALRPVAKLTLGVSVALVAPADSDISGWQTLLEQAAQGLRLGMAERDAAHEVARALLEDEIGIRVEAVAAPDDGAMLANLAEGRTDLAVVTTNAIDRSGADVALRPVVTFGGERSPRYPDTPTFAEVTGDDQNDFTYSFALFGPAELPDEAAATLAAAIQGACTDPEAVLAAGAAGLPLACHDAEIVRQTIERDLGVAGRVAAYLDRN